MEHNSSTFAQIAALIGLIGGVIGIIGGIAGPWLANSANAQAKRSADAAEQANKDTQKGLAAAEVANRLLREQLRLSISVDNPSIRITAEGGYADRQTALLHINIVNTCEKCLYVDRVEIVNKDRTVAYAARPVGPDDYRYLPTHEDVPVSTPVYPDPDKPVRYLVRVDKNKLPQDAPGSLIACNRIRVQLLSGEVFYEPLLANSWFRDVYFMYFLDEAGNPTNRAP
ncbi:MAG: hypothetical protein KF745_09645 [Phycisphaeraceae bacterium]|nr:hypothetical protein [Phycisphaeraceae bacterium]